MRTASYEYQKPNMTYTIDQYIACQSDSEACYHNLSFIDTRDNIEYDTYNILSDYIDVIREEYCIKVILSDDEMMRYMYRPKLLCYDIYGNGELAFIIMEINDMINVKDFTKNKLLMPRKAVMAQLVKYLFNSNKNAMAIYNKK